MFLTISSYDLGSAKHDVEFIAHGKNWPEDNYG